MEIPKLVRFEKDEELSIPPLVRQVADPVAAEYYNSMYPEPEPLEFDYEAFMTSIMTEYKAQSAQVGIYDYEGLTLELLEEGQHNHVLDFALDLESGLPSTQLPAPLLHV
jgi:hypothetical protein